ncbi:MAG TPA: lactonase family protein [Thermomicrobiales bacterium]|nr:lactonase family protein [Thermomicrobiales bacterium]
MSGNAPATWVYVGTFTHHGPGERGRADGFYCYSFDSDSGALRLAQEIPDVPSPAFLALAPDGRTLYAVNEVPSIDGHDGGAVSAFARDPGTGRLSFLNREASHGGDPCHLMVDATGQYVLVANYATGSVAMLPVESDGSLKQASDIHQHSGSSVHPVRQQGPHAHSITPDPTNTVALVADLGLDQVLIYRIDLELGRLAPHDPPFASLHPGAGPRHLAFHPGASFVYVINELDSTITACRWDLVGGVLEPRQTISTLPEGFDGRNSCADVHVRPDGRFLYGSNRGHDSIAIFAIDPLDGTLAPAGHQSTLGEEPRNFGIDPTGRYLLAANQNSDTIVTFRVDGESGRLEETGNVTMAPSPVCLLFATRDA